VKKFLLRAAVIAVTTLGSSLAFAHDPGLSSANVDLMDEQIRVVLTFNARDIAAITNAPQALIGRIMVIEAGQKEIAPSDSSSVTDANNNVEFHFRFPRSNPTGDLTFRSLLLKDLPFGHRQVFTARDANGREIIRELLSTQNDVAHVVGQGAAGGPANAYSFLEFLRLGLRHILTGYDHLLFLFGLLVMCRSGRTAALLITCFTVAHSLTLALSTFGLVNLPGRFVEASIAASIVYVGIENIFRREQSIRWRALLTFAFGLVHGLGFATVLREMGVAQSGLASLVPLVAFNSGVELGQLSVAAIILPVVWLLRRQELFLRAGLPACSVVVAMAGGYWLLERTAF